MTSAFLQALHRALARLATWIMPSHREDWVQAILNECAYIESRREAFKAAVVVIAAAGSMIAGTYAIQKPYQQERIKFSVCQFVDAKCESQRPL